MPECMQWTAVHTPQDRWSALDLLHSSNESFKSPADCFSYTEVIKIITMWTRWLPATCESPGCWAWHVAQLRTVQDNHDYHRHPSNTQPYACKPRRQRRAGQTISMRLGCDFHSPSQSIITSVIKQRHLRSRMYSSTYGGGKRGLLSQGLRLKKMMRSRMNFLTLLMCVWYFSIIEDCVCVCVCEWKCLQ